MNVKLNDRLEITTEHPASHYGAGVLLIDGAAYGPCDELPTRLPSLAAYLTKPLLCAGAVRSACADCGIARTEEEKIIRGEGRGILSQAEIELVNRWLSQDPDGFPLT